MKRITLKKQHIILTSLFLIFLLNSSYKLHSSRVSGVFFGQGIVHLHTSTTFEKTYKNAPKEYKKPSRIEKKAFKSELKKQLKIYFNEKSKTHHDVSVGAKIGATIFMLIIALAVVALLYLFVKLIIFLIGINLILLILSILALGVVGFFAVTGAIFLIYVTFITAFS